MVQAREKLKISFDIKTFLVIFTSVGSISFWGASIVNKIDNMSLAQTQQSKIIEQIVTKRDIDHKVIDQEIARLKPTVNMVLRKLGL